MRKVEIDGSEYNVSVKDNQFYLNDQRIDIDIKDINQNEYHIIVEDQSISAKILDLDQKNNLLKLKIGDHTFECSVKDVRDQFRHFIQMANPSEAQTKAVISPMPGLIQKILVKEGDEIKKNTPLIILNAMKMENVIKASEDGKIERIDVKEEQQVEKGKVLIQF